MSVPHLTTALRGPILDLEQRILDAMPVIEQWLHRQWQDHAAPLYCSVDVRNSGFKLAPVDTNLFPGGFNNLSPDFMPLCVQAMRAAMGKICPDARTVVLIPENHTRNISYLHNIAALHDILLQAGVNVRLGTLRPEITVTATIDLPGGGSLTLEPVHRQGNHLGVEGFDPCMVLLNNDLSAGIPTILQNLEQTIIPPLHAGWATRRKSQHFTVYENVAQEFAKLIGIDPWLINPYFATCSNVDFHARVGENSLAEKVDETLQAIRCKYTEYGIKHDPFVIIKADAGTYGMGIMTVKDAAEVRTLNRRQRNKMAVVKDGMPVTRVLVQEGVYTIEYINHAVAEPVVYMIDHDVVGGFYRVHAGRRADENLNAPGMHFVPLAFEPTGLAPASEAPPDSLPNRFYAYGVVARLALLAAALELERDLGATYASLSMETEDASQTWKWQS
ncbi:glutamate--cysteine ligase [Nitrospira sp. CMX1]